MTNENRLSVKQTAELMGVSEQYIRIGLQQKLFPWGYAVKMSSQWTYWISAPKFFEYLNNNQTKERMVV